MINQINTSIKYGEILIGLKYQLSPTLLYNNSPNFYNQVGTLYTIKLKYPIILITLYVGTMVHKCARGQQIVKSPGNIGQTNNQLTQSAD